MKTVNIDKFKTAVIPLLMAATLMATAGWQSPGAAVVKLSNARFQGLTRVVVDTNVPLSGIDASHITITRPDGSVIPVAGITGIETLSGSLSIGISSSEFALITSEGTTIATKAFGSHRASRAIPVQKPGEPSANGHIMGSSRWTDEGWNTSTTDPAHYDSATGQTGLYRFADLTPNRNEKNQPLVWNNGRVTTPAHRASTMLVLFVEFPDRRAADAEAPYLEIPPYLEFLQGAVEWCRLSSYGQFRLALASPQSSRNLGWIMMEKNASQYPWGGQTHQMFAYVREACQKAYEKWGVRADTYDLLLIMPAMGRSGLRNGPSNINRDPGDSQQPNVNHVAYVDRDGKPHYVGTALTAGNDLFRWGYRWLLHEAGHAFGFPDLYMYRPTVNGVRVGSFFYCGGWDMMGNIAGHSTEFLAWHKWKLRWVRDDQVDVVSRSSPEPTRHFITPVETPGGSKMVVIRTGLSTAYVAEFRTRLGVNALEGRAKYAGVLIYRVDAAQWESRETTPTAQIISRQYYNSPAVGGPKNLTGVWRPVENTITGYDAPDCLWQPGDVFSDPATGVTIRLESITHQDAADPDNSPYTADDIAALTVIKTGNAELFKGVILSNARIKDLVSLSFDTNIELRLRIPITGSGNSAAYDYVREDSVLSAGNVVIAKGDGTVVPAARITGIVVSPTGVQVTLAKGTFATAADAARATVATRAFYHFGAGAAARIGNE